MIPTTSTSTASTRPGALAVVLGTALVLLGGCGERDSEVQLPVPEVVLAEVGGETVTPSELIAEADRRLARNQPVPSKEALLEEMVERLALLQRARNSGLSDEPDVKRELENLLIAKVRAREFDPSVREAEIEEASLEQLYREQIDELTRPAQVRLAVLHLECDPKESDTKRTEVRARMEEARAMALSAPPPGGRGPAAGGFGALAIRYSDDQVGRYRGGDAGWLEVGSAQTRWPVEVIAAGEALGKDELSEVIEADGGFYLIKKTDSRPAVTTSFEEVRPALRQRALTAKRKELEAAFREETWALASARIFPDRLEDVELPSRVTGARAGSEDQERPPTIPGVGN